VTRIIDGRAIAAAMGADVTAGAAALRARGITPALAVVVATADEGAAWYVRSLRRTAEKAGIDCRVHDLGADATAETIAGCVDALAADDGVHGIICQTPLPPGVAAERVVARIGVAKDVDGAAPESLGMLAAGVPGGFAPATAAAVLEILRREGVALAGRRAVVVGRSTVVGKPAALLLLAEHATVTICHSRTVDLPAVCRAADVLVAAAGRARLIGAGHVRPGTVVIDVGTNAVDGAMVGDVDAAAVDGIAAAITPVPGGVGPVTTMTLMHHTLLAAGRAAGGGAGRAAGGGAAAR
jgi:methylenetetrahydrofolate dehydrogenase (NADP+) / methenyltetrahydrofolate cyclohydrolase